MTMWHMVVDVAKCINCHNCALSVQDEFVGNAWPGYSAPMPKHEAHWIEIRKKERGQGDMLDVAFAPVMCQHCDEAPCMAAARDGAIKKRDDGIVIIDPEKAKGQRQIVEACPFGAIWWNEEEDVPQAWFFDAHLLDDGWTEPRCVTVCPTGALQSYREPDADWQRRVADENLKPFDQSGKTKPRVLYRNLDRYTHCFIGGTVMIQRDGVEDCCEDAEVSLSQNGAVAATVKTDGFGDFKFDGLAPDSGTYEVTIDATGFAPAARSAELGESLYLGEVALDASDPAA